SCCTKAASRWGSSRRGRPRELPSRYALTPGAVTNASRYDASGSRASSECASETRSDTSFLQISRGERAGEKWIGHVAGDEQPRAFVDRRERSDEGVALDTGLAQRPDLAFVQSYGGGAV